MRTMGEQLKPILSTVLDKFWEKNILFQIMKLAERIRIEKLYSKNGKERTDRASVWSNNQEKHGVHPDNLVDFDEVQVQCG
eukprot:gene4289-47031_t